MIIVWGELLKATNKYLLFHSCISSLGGAQQEEISLGHTVSAEQPKVWAGVIKAPHGWHLAWKMQTAGAGASRTSLHTPVRSFHMVSPAQQCQNSWAPCKWVWGSQGTVFKERAIQKPYHLLWPSLKVTHSPFCIHWGNHKGLPRFKGREKDSTSWWGCDKVWKNI